VKSASGRNGKKKWVKTTTWKKEVGEIVELPTFRRVAVLWSAVTKEPCKRDYILQKRLIMSRSLLIIAHIAVLGSAVTSPVSVLQHAAHVCKFGSTGAC